MHLNMSLSKDGKNIFADPNDKIGLSKEAYSFIAGIMKHIKGMTVLTNPLVNSYKRLVPGYEAPVYIAWSATNRSPLIRIPGSRGESTRIELRCPDPAANPYMVLAVCLAAGLDGIKNQLVPVDSIDRNIFEMTQADREEAGIESLPENLCDAIEKFEQDEFVQNVIGKHIAKHYINAKKKEWQEYRTQVTDWEIEQYLHKF